MFVVFCVCCEVECPCIIFGLRVGGWFWCAYVSMVVWSVG